ncbi:hypothetical protein ACFFMR_06945 [Micromonospora andamanensis]|uniref:LigA protein n=1 Tax=Micromonospora andamanensis TaxID=1287068 RepID=A0ABQ4HMU5_9ACTN|nr:hypothetical protein [Micromonospora andamanensis]GIJ06956.1 hypothetical protein Van01_01700 [Micromonospora andamanensis]
MTVLARAGLLLAATVTTILATAAPALAHGADAPNGTDYRVTVTDTGRPDLRVRVIEAGARLELTNTGDTPIEVIGYSGEPYLRVGPDGVYENSRSPATYLNRTIVGDTALPAEADPAAEPRWRRLDGGTTVRWHDQRALWREAQPPAQVRAAPDREHRVRDWVVPLRDADGPSEIRGTLDWVPPPDAYTWWVVATVGALAVGALGVLPATSGPGRRALVALGALLIVGGTAAVALALGRTLDAGSQGLGGVLTGLLTGPVWALLTGLAAIAAGARAVRGGGGTGERTSAPRSDVDFVVALAGVCLALFAGVTNAAGFTRAVLPVPWPPTVARVLVVLVLAGGAGALAAALLRLHAAARRAPAAATP